MTGQVVDHLDFWIGDKAVEMKQTHNLTYPVRSAIIEDWELMEKFWHRCLHQYLRAEPEESVLVLTEPPMNPPENRETMAEIMFETFGVKGLYIAVQAVMSLYSNWCLAKPGSMQKELGLTGSVLDAGDGVTHVIPIWGG